MSEEKKCCEIHEHEHEHGHGEERSLKDYLFLGARIVVSLTLALLGLLVFKEDSYPFAVNFMVMLIAYLVIAYDIIFETVENIFVHHEFFDEDTLMIVASIGAFALRAFGKEHNEFFEAVMVVLLFQIGEVLEDLAADKSKEAILKAIDCKEELANVAIGEKIVQKKGEDLCVDDIVLVGNGEKILCDGEVIEGSGEVNESSLSGESRLIAKEVGSTLYSGTILVSGHLRVIVKKTYDDSTVARLIEMIESAHESKSRSERFITKFARVYTPIVVVLALLIAVIPPLFLGIGDGSVWSRWVYSALSFLVVSCPCAIVISVPLAYFSGLGLASKHGILVKGGSFFDAINETKTVAFDKTGTVTEGKLSLYSISPVGASEEELLDYLRIIESLSDHPLAKAVYGEESKRNYDFESYQEISGKGIKAVLKGQIILAGRASFLEEEDVSMAVEPTAETSIHVAVDGTYIGFASFKDRIKETSEEFVKSVKKQGICTVLLSGDQENAVKNVAETLGVDEYRSGLLPEEKLSAITELKNRGNGKVAYLGDGINDAPTLVASDVGVAMGGLGSDLAVANADVVILNDDPARFSILRSISKSTRNRALFNIAFSLSVKVAIMTLGVIASSMGTWELPLWVSVLGDTGVTILAIFFSLLLQAKRFKD